LNASGASELHLLGTVYPGKTSVVTAPFKGTITSLNSAVLGNTIRKDELIATLDSTVVRREIKQAQIASREAEIAYQKLLNWNSSAETLAAKRALETAKQILANETRLTVQTRQLFNDGIVAASELEQNKQSLQSAESAAADAEDRYQSVLDQGNTDRLNFARQRLDLAQEELTNLTESISRGEIRAPQGGIILPAGKQDTPLAVGQTVPEGDAILLIGATEFFQIRTSVSETDVHRLSLGQTVQLSSPVYGEAIIPGEVVSISKYTSSFLDGPPNSKALDRRPPRVSLIIHVKARELGIEAVTRMGMSVDISVASPAE